MTITISHILHATLILILNLFSLLDLVSLTPPSPTVTSKYLKLQSDLDKVSLSQLRSRMMEV